MCIIIYKGEGKPFPPKETMKTCFDNNPDGAGYMLAVNKKVIIKKGFMTFHHFYSSLKETRKLYGDDVPYVMHFRITTQGGVNKYLTHPYPLSSEMDELKQLNTTAKIGIAHNGIIHLTSNNSKDYNDTMKFITDYLSLIIDSPNYYKDEKKMLLITRLCGSKLAILDNLGHCELIGNGWIEDKGIYYSNSSYKKNNLIKNFSTNSYSTYDADDDWEYFDYSDEYIDDNDECGLDNCLYKKYNDAMYCDTCDDCHDCELWWNNWMEDDTNA